MRAAPTAWATGLMLLAAATAAADTLDATLSQALSEADHQVRLRIKDGVARFVVRRTLKNAGERHDQAEMRLMLPVGAAATGLRIKAGDNWYSGELMGAERAERLYRELTGFGPHAVKDPALLSWLWANELSLQIFPVAPSSSSTVEYTLTAPTRYRDGQYLVSYPFAADGQKMVAPELRWLSAEDGETFVVDGSRHGAGETIALAPTPPPAWLEGHDTSGSATYVGSALTVDDDVKIDKLKVAFDVRHTYRGDLAIELLTPKGEWHTLAARGGGGENDLREGVEVKLGEAQSAKGTWRLVISDHAALDVGSLESWSLSFESSGRAREVAATGLPLFLPDAPGAGAAGQASISVPAPSIRTVATRLGRVPVAEGKAFSRLEIDVAEELRHKPKELAVVFVVDASHSIMRDAGIDGQLALARSFLGHVPDARFEVVLYGRKAERMVGSLAPAGEIDARIAAARKAGALEPRNGSALDEGLRVAVEALAGEPKPRTIVVLNDDLLRSSWNNQAALDALERAAAGTTVHLVVTEPWDNGKREERDDAHALAPIAAKRGGVLLRFRDTTGADKKEIDALTLGLVRPIRIDGFAVEGLPAVSSSLPDVLEEGDGIREMVLLPAAPAKVVLTGKIWAKRFRREVKATLPFSRATAAFVFSHDLHHELSPEEQFRVAMIGRAVSPVTSYLAIEPGVRPSPVGLQLSGIGEGGGGRGEGIGLGAARTIGHAREDLKQKLEPAVKACAAKHSPAPGWTAAIDLDLTFDEIVDVIATGPASTMQSCIVEAAWELRLSFAFGSRRDKVALAWP
jgi:Mg-chelatase subunit ChlD